MTTRQKKPWHDEASCRGAESYWVERKTRMAIREGGKCGFCGYTPQPEFRTGLNPTQKQNEGMKQMLLIRHMRSHLDDEGDQSDKWQHQLGFNHRGQIKPKGGKP